MKWFIFGVAILTLGIALLFVVGRFFISEVTQEVKIIPAPEAGFSEVGRLAPLWVLSDQSGQKVKFSGFLGKPAVIIFWATWNKDAENQFRTLDEYVAKFGEKDAIIVTMNSQEDSAAVANFLARGGYKVRVVFDEQGAVGELYGVRNLPTTFFVDKEGVIMGKEVRLLSLSELRDKIVILSR